MYQFLFCFTSQSWLDDILTLKVFYLVQRMFELGHLTCLRIDLVNKEVVPISAKDENVNVTS